LTSRRRPLYDLLRTTFRGVAPFDVVPRARSGIPMYAVIKTGGKQYRVAANQVIKIERLEGEVGSTITFPEVLMVGGEVPVVGTPTVAGAAVTATVLEQTRGEKLIIFKKKRRKNYRRRNGHRQHLTVVRIAEIAVA
jgi:large subunit ribosomal protein L21